MRIYGATPTPCNKGSIIFSEKSHLQVLVVGAIDGDINRKRLVCPTTRLPETTGLALSLATASAVVLSVMVLGANAVELRTQQQQEAETLSNIPQMLSSECVSGQEQDCKKTARIQRPKSRKAEVCTTKCVTTCIRGGFGSPGEGPFNVGRPLVVFKQGFRSRHYCLVECSDICNLIGDGEDGP